MPGIQGHPDWLQTQASTGPALYRATGAAPAPSGTIYTGQWRTYFMAATITGGTGVWQITVDFAQDALNTQKVLSPVTIVGNGVPRIGWQPIVGQYITITPTLTVPSVGDSISITVVPSLLDAPQATRIITTPYVTRFESQQNAQTFTLYNGTYSMPGPALLTTRSNQYYTLYDVQAMDNTGTFNSIMRYQGADVNQANPYPLQIPDKPVLIKISNVEDFAAATFDVILAPA